MSAGARFKERHPMSQKRIRRVPVKQLTTEEGSDELVASQEMQPYVRLAMAALKGADLKSVLEQIHELPLEKRYVWRVASALKWGFADFDSSNVVADRETLSPEDLAKLGDLLRLRPIQFCLFLTALLGFEPMERLLTEAIGCARKQQG